MTASSSRVPGLLVLLLPALALSQALPEEPPFLLGQWNGLVDPYSTMEPLDVAASPSGEIYAICEDGFIIKYAADGTPLLQFGDTEIVVPFAIAVDPTTDHVIVGHDSGTLRVTRFSASGQNLGWWIWVVTEIAGMDVDDSGRLWITVDEEEMAYCYSPIGFNVGGLSLWDEGFSELGDLALDSRGRIYLTDRYNRRVALYGDDLHGSGTVLLREYGEDPPYGLGETLRVTVDAQDNVFILHLLEGVLMCVKIDREGNVLSSFPLPGASSMDAYGAGTLYVAADGMWIQRYGYPPTILGIEDMLQDQGHWVRLSWRRSALDRLNPALTISGYGVYRRGDDTAALLPAERVSPFGDELMKGLEGWDVIGSVPARGDSTYSLVAPTLADSTGTGGVAWSVFVVTAFAHDGSYWDCAPDSGYSVDNLPPPVPGAPTVIEDPGQLELELSWQASPAPDLGHYAVYRGTTAGFVPASPTSPYATTIAPYFTDGAVAPGETWYYRVGVFDDAETFSGYSSSAGAKVLTSTPTPSRPTALLQNLPNPFNPSTEIPFHLAREEERVRLSIYDLSGALVRELADGPMIRGPHVVRWDGRDGSGQSVASGVYLYRLRTAEFEQTRRMVLLR